MGIVAIAVVVIAITFIVLVGFMIPALIEIRKGAAAIRTFITDVESQLQPVLKELRELTPSLHILIDVIVSKTDEVKSFMAVIGDTGRNINRINVVIGAVTHIFFRSFLWIIGLKAACRYVINRIAKKGR